MNPDTTMDLYVPRNMKRFTLNKNHKVKVLAIAFSYLAHLLIILQVSMSI